MRLAAARAGVCIEENVYACFVYLSMISLRGRQ